MIDLTCCRSRRALKASQSAVLSPPEDETSTAPVAAETLSLVKMEDENVPLEFTDDHPDMEKYISFISFRF
jgi:hypothetical protein